ncbi:MBL fold metallo-hydrolase [Algoriphagus sp.]|uniref:MBL fold metallo-hydrolase n=1 Tax=Algoriphagus sp. TaxID=1872435 RepID=UPI0025F37002|nr:MBL fold metallo-hydrolase [Algoriphagus sp.]
MKKLNSILFVFFLAIGSLSAQNNMDQVKISVEKVADNVYVLFGSGGNIGLAVGDDYAYMIDDQFAALSDKILAAVKTVTEKPIKYLVNTHWHGDHTGGNENMANAGAIIVAHESVRERMSQSQNANSTFSFKSLPEITFTDELNIHLDEDHMLMVLHVDAAHTDGDSFIYFPESNVIHLGDNFPNGGYPFIDVNSNGDIEGLVKNLNSALFLVNDETKIIPGHGKVSNRAELKAYRDMIDTIRGRVKIQKDAGKSLEEIQSMGLTKEWDEQFGQGFINATRLIESIFKTVD